jgi:murein DD-endopeptidase MepM/ murein hydrolase activator NlpD
MAINADQLLNRPSELHRRYGGRLAMQKAQQEKMVGGGPSNIVLSKKSIKGIEGIKINVIKIEDILKGSLALDKKQLDDKKKATSKKRKEDIETKLETKPNAESGGKVKLPAAPRMGILDFIKNFIGNVLLGYFAVRLIKHLPKIMPIVKFLGNAADFIIDVGGKLLTGLLTFAQKGQEAHDKTRGFIKNLGGENFAKGFDKFIGAIDTALFLTTVLAGSMAMEAMSGGGGGGPGGPGPRRQPTRTTSGGRTLDTPNIRNPVRQKPTVTTGGATPRPMGGGPKITGDVSGGGKLKLPSKSGIRAGGIAALVMLIPDLINSGMLVSQGRPKDGIRTFLSAIAGVGAGMAAIAGVTAGAAALGITGVGIPAAIALAIAGFAASSAASFLAYEGTDALLKKMGLIDNDPKTRKPYAYKSGGITRGGKSAGRVRRTVSKGKYKRVLTPQKPSKTELKTEAFTKPENKTLKESTEELDKTKYFGPILAISSKIMNKEEPTDRDYQNVGLGINLLIAKGIQDKQLKGGVVAAFAEGGLVDPDVLSATETGGDISNWVAKAFRGAIETGAQKTMRLMKEMREMKKIKEKTGSGENEYGGDGDGGGGGSLTSGVWGPILDLIASKESGGSYTKMYGGKENPSLVNMTLQEVSAFQAAHAKKTGSAAMGRYQFMNALGQGAAVGLKPTDKFSPENQDKMAVGLIVNKRKVTLDMIKSNPDEAMIRLGMEWAAIGMPKSMRGHRRMVAAGETYYAGDGVNKAHITPAQMRAAFAKTLGGGYSQAELAKSQAGSSGSFSMGDTASVKGGKAFPLTKGRPGVSEGQVFNGPRRGRRHAGVDVVEKAPWGKDPRLPINAYAAGKVISERYNASDPYLSGLMIDHGGIQTRYLHATPSVRPGDVVKAGQPIGRLLNLGGQTHLHFEAYQGSKLLNPTSMLNTAAFAKGGRVYKKTFAMLGEKGTPEFVFDYDTTRGLDSLAPRLLDKLNRAKTKPQLARILEFYAPKPQSPNIASFPSYNEMSESSQTFIVQSPPPPSDDYGSDGGGGGVLIASGGSGFADKLYKGDG